MARGGGGRRREAKEAEEAEEAEEPQAFHEFGIRGRKTGAFLKDTGARDEHGMQPIEDIFSSPGRSDGEPDGSGSEDMDISFSAGPGPQTVLKKQRSIAHPIKTNLGPSARRSSHLDPSSSLSRGSSADRSAVTRKLDFASKGNKAKTNGQQKATRANRSFQGGGNESGESDEVVGANEDLDISDMIEASMHMVDAMQSDPVGPGSMAMAEEEEEEEEEPVLEATAAQNKRARGRPPKAAPKPEPKAAFKAASKAQARAPPDEPPIPEEPEESEEPEEEPREMEVEEEEPEEEEAPVQRRKGRPSKKNQQQREGPPSDPKSKKRRSLRNPTDGDAAEESQAEEEDDDEAPRKRQRTTAPALPKAAPPKAKPADKSKAPAPASAERRPKPRGRPGREAKAADADADADASAAAAEAGEASFVALRRGPPMPRPRGLVSMRKDTMTQTRSGRHSYRPVDYWRGEQLVVEEEELADMFHRDGFVMPSIKEVVRVPEEAAPSKSASRGGKARPRAKKPVPEEQLEEWEVNPGIVEGEIVLWEAEHEEHPPADDEPVQVTDERIAISANAVQTSDIRDATFRFAKTLTMPFIGAGVVDLPPGGEKRPKNSRKMHMVFFVHCGKVMVTINEVQFRISAGGMWFVPRGNYYSIANDYDIPSRVFFCQACEISSTTQLDASQFTFTT